MGMVEVDESWQDKPTMEEEIQSYVKRKNMYLSPEQEKKVCERLIEKIYDIIDDELQGVIAEVEEQTSDEI